MKRTEITKRQEWDGGVPGEHVTIDVPSTDRLSVLLGDAVITLQQDEETGRVEITVVEGSVLLWT